MPEKLKDVIAIPYHTDAEQCVLGALMLDNDRWDDINLLITADDFFVSAHRAIYRAMSALASRLQPFDLITLSETLERDGRLDTAGGFAYLAEIGKNTPSAANILSYVGIVLEKSRLRQLQIIGNSLLADIRGNRLSSLNVAAQAEEALFTLSEKGQHANECETEILQALDQLLSKLEVATAADTGITGTATGMAEVDFMTCGLQPGDLVILAARPSMGKTSLALSWSIGALMSRPQESVFIFSIEMPTEQLMMRMLSMRSRVELNHLRSGNLSDEDWGRISMGAKEMAEWRERLVIDDNSSQTPATLRTRARRYIRKYGKPSLIMVDYLQLVRCPDMENRTQEIAEISRSLKALGKELGCPILALSQLNRQVEQRADKRPNNGDLRDSGALEQDADLIAFIYRDEVYHADTAHPGQAEIIISKQRQGPTGTIKTQFDGRFTLFSEYPEGGYDFGYDFRSTGK
ncbi:SPI-7-type island replicative DNA helicase [Pantoea sp. JK]|uniref:SPI-7-type island replicative DNA helicase n=1 Tax=Pantoea sp. JK TaxID=2871703 RepID=UPI0022390115|nr:SPI-7-type island replicative DNA helicase [Pantoea sp. JK]MCW6034413.1 replicative DNA helicase [Pantoea sp. JK]